MLNKERSDFSLEVREGMGKEEWAGTSHPLLLYPTLPPTQLFNRHFIRKTPFFLPLLLHSPLPPPGLDVAILQDGIISKYTSQLGSRQWKSCG